MKKILSVLAVLIMLLPGAFANTVSQSNDGSAIGAGCQGIISQDGLNAALAIGAGNDITQKNDQKADSMGCFFVDQMATNAALAFGNGNNIFQSNTADGVGGVVYQKQLNAIVAMGCGNAVDQSNNAKAVEELPYSSIMQVQTNLGMVAGKNNDLTQKNKADATLPKTTDKIEIDPVILQVQANNALQLGKGNGMTQTNYARAEIQALTGATFGAVDQFQNNNGAQIGEDNGMTQVNGAAAKIEFEASSKAEANAEASSKAQAAAFLKGKATAKASSSASASADARAFVGPTTVVQKQDNNGMQIGEGNIMRQSNDADAYIEAAAFAEATANAKADSYALAMAAFKGDADATANAKARARASANAIVGPSTIVQDQDNNGMQIGEHNTMVQKNEAYADIGAWARAVAKADADACSSAKAFGFLCLDADAAANSVARAEAYANAIVCPNTIVQNQGNNGVQLGKFNSMVQSNIEAADIKAFADAKAEASAGASANACALLGDSVYSAAYSSALAATSAYSGPNLIMQNQENCGLELGKGGILTQTNDANAEKPKIPTLDPIIIQNQNNLGVLISNC
ncbi:MAG: hypothetical protein E4G89_00740 [Methanothrix sp.]|nr:MAG: hypothetical protein E4G89_00740 [Methanothrix sp.]